MTLSAATRVAAVIGSPVRHSLSPAIQNAGFESVGADWAMVAFDIAPGAAADAVHAMQVLGIGGLAVTMPHKHDVAGAVDELHVSALRLGAVNTVVLRDDGSTFGLSTDGDGFVESLRAQGVGVADQRIVVLGAGGAARSIIEALGRADAAEIVVVNRTSDGAVRAADLADVARPGDLEAVEHADLLVNATSVGMGSAELPVDPELLHEELTVCDIVYHPLATAMLTAARARGCATVDGLGMLVHQAVLQQQAWTGSVPDPAVMRAAAEVELGTRA